MKTLNLDILLKTPKNILVKDINLIFNNLLNEIQNYLGLEAIHPNIIINITMDPKTYSVDFFSLGVRRTILNDQTQIHFSEKFLKFLEIILLREAYLIFVPYELKEKQIIQIVIHEIIESDLFKLEAMSEWKKLVRSNIINYDFLFSQFDKLDKFFKLEATEMTQSPTQFFFEFIRRNISLIQDKMDDFYDILYEEFIYKISKSLFNNEIVETIKILVEIFYQVKLFKKYSEFEELFQEFKDKGLISTFLSKRKFSENLRWINKNTVISPSFQPNYQKINVVGVISILKFNPLINRKKIYKIIDKIPFLHNPVFTERGFSEEIHCYFIIPQVYLKDLLNFIKKLTNFGYITNKECYIWIEHNNILNLNYFRESFKNLRKIINPNHKEYDINSELKFSTTFGDPCKTIDLNLLEWLIFERVAHPSLIGFGFEHRTETLQSLKDELLNLIMSERGLISNLRSILYLFYESVPLKQEFLDFIEANQKFGFFYIDDMLQKLLTFLERIERVINQNPEINNLVKLQEFLKSHHISQLIEENLSFKNKNIQSIVLEEFIILYFNSFQKYQELKQKYTHFHNLFNSCKKLKIFNIEMMKKIIGNEKLIESIYGTKEEKLKQSFEKFKPYKITNQKLDIIFKRFHEKGLIFPLLINTIFTSSFAKYHPIVLLKDSIEVNKQLEKILKFFPRVFLDRVRDSFKDESRIMIFMFFLNIKEKELLSSILYNLFKEDLISFKRYFTSGLSPFLLIKDFYDFDSYEFFYTKDLFEQCFHFIQKILGEIQNPLQEVKTNSQEIYWSKEKNILNLVKEVNSRVSHEDLNFNIKVINEFVEFYKNLDEILLNHERFKNYRQTQFFKKFIKSIKFIPNFHSFGFDQFYLYIHPSNVDEIDIKHLLINTFQSIKYPNIIDDTNSFLIKYIFPFGNPNMKHLNWYTKTKRVIREYCLYCIKCVYQILNFNQNLSLNGWNYDSNRFKIYMQNILFNPEYKNIISTLKTFKMRKLSQQGSIEKNSVYFKALSEIFTWKSIDIKSFLGTQKYSIIKNITDLLNNNLIFPYISVKNLDFQEKIYIIIPGVDKKLNDIIINVFNFFNFGFIFGIEGQFYMHGFDEELKFENGFMIKLYFPQCELDEFLKLFDLLFEYLGINNYIILTDLVSGKNLLKGIFGDLGFLDSYNPLTNLKWNDKDKIWMNHKIYTDKFEKIYPDL
jgi:hypothetical protein